MEQDNWQRVRELFEAVCELPQSQWRQALAQLSSDRQTIAQALTLLQAQTGQADAAQDVVDQLLKQVAGNELAEGERLGPWRLQQRLAGGGMGLVFLAERADDLYARQVAIKLLRGQAGARGEAQLAAECRILAGLEHPHIARLHDGGLTPAGHPYLVMEYVQGQSLEAWSRDPANGLDQRLTLFLQICAAVSHAHARLVLHCDIKPSNVLVRHDNGQAALLDFGVARLVGSDGLASSYCTPAYAAPELLAGNRLADTRSDVFGLGLLLCDLLTTEPASRQGADNALPPPPSVHAPAGLSWRSKLHGDLDAIVARACAQDPAQRYPSVDALAADVRAMRDRQPVAARGGGRGYRLLRWTQRHWRGMTVAVFVLGLSLLFVQQLRQARDMARHEAEVAGQVTDYMVHIFEAADPRVRGVRGGDRISVNEVLDTAAAKLEADLEQAPEVRARLLAVIGNALLNIGDKPRAYPLLESAAEAMAKQGGMKNLDEAARLLNMAAGGHAQERRAVQAEAMARRALALMGKVGEGTFRQAQSYNSLGLALLAQQRYDEAEQAFKAALANHQRGGREHFVGVTRDNLGMMHRRRGQAEQALQQFALSTPMFERTMGQMSFDFWVSNTEYGMALLEAGRLDQAIALFEDNLERAPGIFGDRSVYLASEHHRLALALLRKGEYARAGQYLERALALSADVMGQDSYTYSLQLEAKARLAMAQGALEQAEALARQVLAVREADIGQDNVDSHDAALLLAQVLVLRGQADAAAPLLQRVHTLWRPVLSARSSNAVRIGHVQAQWLMLQGRNGQAAGLLASLQADAQALNAPLAGEQARLQALAAAQALAVSPALE